MTTYHTAWCRGRGWRSWHLGGWDALPSGTAWGMGPRWCRSPSHLRCTAWCPGGGTGSPRWCLPLPAPPPEITSGNVTRVMIVKLFKYKSYWTSLSSIENQNHFVISWWNTCKIKDNTLSSFKTCLSLEKTWNTSNPKSNKFYSEQYGHYPEESSLSCRWYTLIPYN